MRGKSGGGASGRIDVTRLAMWKKLGAIMADEFAQLLGETVAPTAGWPASLGRDQPGATILMSLARDEVEVLVSVAADASALAWLGRTLLSESAPSDAALKDVLRELASTAGGAVKRVALAENVTLTTGLADQRADGAASRRRHHVLRAALRGGQGHARDRRRDAPPREPAGPCVAARRRAWSSSTTFVARAARCW